MKKRIIAGLTIKDNLVVQSISYEKYLPLGKLEYFVKNLNRWCVDEILIRDIDAYKSNKAPNFQIIETIKKLSYNTPLINGGGILNSRFADKLFDYGVDRILLESIFFENKKEYESIINSVGAQSVVLSLSLNNGKLVNYNDKKNVKNSNIFIDHDFSPSEVLINDIKNDGSYGKFDEKNINIFKNIKAKLICHGGLTNIKTIKKILNKKNVSAICISNFLNFKEHQYQHIKKNLNLNSLRKEIYEN